jgi:multicomponent Na+:H+ antiporter subunit E
MPAALLSLLWLLLTAGDVGSWIVGLPSVMLAVFALNSLRGGQRMRLRVRQLPGFIGWFVWQSLLGGVDVAWRALRPGMSLRAGFVRYPLTLAPGPARTFMVNCVSLLPGTLSAELVDDELLLHALDTKLDVVAGTRAVERQVGRLLGGDRLNAYE